jgi:hypothetical protein
MKIEESPQKMRLPYGKGQEIQAWNRKKMQDNLIPRSRTQAMIAQLHPNLISGSPLLNSPSKTNFFMWIDRIPTSVQVILKRQPLPTVTKILNTTVLIRNPNWN